MKIRFKMFFDCTLDGIEGQVNDWLSSDNVIPHEMRLELTTHNNFIVSFLYTPRPDRKENNDAHI